MSLTKKIYVLLFIFILFIAFSVYNNKSYADTLPSILTIKCNGKSQIYSNQQYGKLSDESWLGDVTRGALLNEIFFYIDHHDNYKIKSTNMISSETKLIIDLNAHLKNNHKPWQIGYVDNSVIYISSKSYEKNLPVNKQKPDYFIYKIDRNTREVKEINIPELGSPYFTAYAGHVFYTSTNGGIYEYEKGEIKPLKIKGNFPSISPDGTKMAFVSFGLINEKILLYDMKSKNHISLISFFGPKSVDPIIRWSNNSEYIVVKQQSDLKDKPLYLVSTTTEKVIQKVKDSHACNWFLIDKKQDIKWTLKKINE